MTNAAGFSFRPKSFFSLVLIGFCLVVTPLVVALVSGVFYVDRLFVQSEFAVYRAAQAGQVSRGLVGQITEMERNVRQFLVLHDEELWQSYRKRREQFLETAKQLGGLAESDMLKSQLETLSAKEEVLYRSLAGEIELAAAINPKDEFDGLNQLAQGIIQESQAWVDSQVKNLSGMADETKRLLMWQAMALVPGTLLIAIFISGIIARPIRQLDQAIRSLGAGNYTEEVIVRGPRDLRYLGERLNWLGQRLAELDERKGNFLRHVSHELKTPLTALREGSALLAEGLLGELTLKQRDVVQLLQRNALNLQGMIENLLNFNMLQAKQAALDLRDVRLDDVVDDVAAEHKIALMAKKIRLELDCQPSHVEGDQQKLRTILDNLISNAIKYSPVRGCLRVQLRQQADSVVVDVSDQGPGILPIDAERVFDAFYRGVSIGKDVRGSGIGLAIVKEFVAIHNGKIEVISEATPGAHFRVTLPIQQAREVA